MHTPGRLIGIVPALVLTLTLTAPASVIRAQAPAPGPSSSPTSFRVDVVGHGRPMVLIPGLSSSGDTWKTTVARYQDRFRCHVVTLAGFAGVPPIAQPLMATVRADLATYIRSQGLDRPVIVGHSLGGTLALALAADHPDLVGPLVIVDSLPFLAGPQMQANTLDDARAGIAAMRAYMTLQTPKQYEDYVRSGAATSFMVTSPADLETIKGWGLGSDQRTVAEAMADLMGLDLRQDVARITTPTLVLGTWSGLHEQMKQYGTDIPRAAFIQTFDEQFAKLPRLHFALAETARHFIMFDDPQWFFAQVDAFLADPNRVVGARGFAR
jgi:pimeloyl-ACP methyl ester carboxylesterase